VQKAFDELPKSDIETVVGGNLIGTMNGVHLALTKMKKQGHGHVFTMEGYGSDGATQPGMSIYGSTKTAIRYFTKSVVEETRGGPVKVGSLSPGIVVTDLLLDVYRKGTPENWKRQRWLFELIADPVEDVAPWLVDQVLAGPAHGEHVAWMTVFKAILRAFQPRFYRRKLFAGRIPTEE
jgi:NADP-dependent 3-hydroxy acid dehydrogenase YdfG